VSLEADFTLARGAFRLAARFETPLSGIIAVFGPSGAGKSMLLSALAGLDRIDDGRISLSGRVLDDAAARVRVAPHLRGVGLVFQDARLFPHLSVRGNLAYACERAPAGRRKLTLEDAAAYFDIGALLDRPTRNLSGGEKSRVALARALLSAPDLLLLDEPFAALDGARRRAFLAILRRMHEAFALPMLVVTHQIDDVAALADHLIALDAGQVAAAGPIAQASAAAAFQELLDARDSGAAVTLTTAAGEASTVWIRADHVLLANAPPAGLSARHVWKTEIVELIAEGANSVLVRLASESGPLRARVTPAAASELGLAPGGIAWAIVKAHAL
jgi:molybdate transport system ATP-binding protein